MTELFKSQAKERRLCNNRLFSEAILTFVGFIVLVMVVLGGFLYYGYQVVEVKGTAIPSSRAVKTWVKAEIVKTEHLKGQDIVGLGTTGSRTGMVSARALEENSIYYVLPSVGDGRTVYKADVNYQFLLEAERAKGFEVQVRTDNRKKNFLVDESTVRPLTLTR